MKTRKMIGKLLLAFVLVSVGFAIGKEFQKRRTLEAAGPPVAAGENGENAENAGNAGSKVVVYYMHASYRCMTCNMVEATADELIRTEFADALTSGRLEWKRANFQEDEQLADRYSVGGIMIVVAKFRDGKEVAHKRLDQVMELANRQGELQSYVRDAIRELLEEKS